MKLYLAITLFFAGAVGEYARVSFCALYSVSKNKKRAQNFKIMTVLEIVRRFRSISLGLLKRVGYNL